MSLFTKILVIFIVILNIIYFSLVGTLFSYRVHYKNKFQDKEKELKDTIKKDDDEITDLRGKIQSTRYLTNEPMKARIDNIKTAVKHVVDRLDIIQKIRIDISQRVNELTANNQKWIQDLRDLNTMNNDLQTQLTSYRERQQNTDKEKESVQDAMQKVADELAKDNKQLSLLNDEYLELSKKYQFVEQQIQHYKQLAIKEPIGPPKVIRGKVLAVSDTGNILIISPGEPDGVTIGTEFTIYRGDKFVGKIRVDSIYKEYSTALIIPETVKDKVKIEDSVITSPY